MTFIGKTFDFYLKMSEFDSLMCFQTMIMISFLNFKLFSECRLVKPWPM